VSAAANGTVNGLTKKKPKRRKLGKYLPAEKNKGHTVSRQANPKTRKERTKPRLVRTLTERRGERTLEYHPKPHLS